MLSSQVFVACTNPPPLYSSQARMQSTEAQLAETAAQLQDLKSRQKQLEARNALLEKVANIQKQPDAPEATNTVSLPWQVFESPRLAFCKCTCLLHNCATLA